MGALKPGFTGQSTLVVQEIHTAKHLRSGTVDVLATPIMVALMEEAARNSVDPHLEPHELSVGTALEVTHRAATPIGMRVTARAELLGIEGRKLTFRVIAEDEHEVIGQGTHVRAIVNRESFLGRLRKKVGDNR
jgi:fluoroacetyl-CoA thioesterase